MSGFYAIMFSATLGAPAHDFRPSVSAGPFPTEQVCYAAAALAISSMNQKHPGRDFRAVCRDKPDIVRHPGEPLYDLRMVAALAGHPFATDEQ